MTDILRCSVLIVVVFASTALAAPWQPPMGIDQIPLWPDSAKIARPEVKGEESVSEPKDLVAGRRWNAVLNVTRPTMAVFPAKGANTGAAVIVFPGGGYNILAIDLEGTEVCDWLAEGVTCIVLKYRVPGSGPHWDEKCKCERTAREPMALQDAQRAIVLVREHAQEWGIDPHKIGVLGFSAGGHLSAEVSNQARLHYKPVDDADKQSFRPDFSVVIYPGHMWDGQHLDKIKFGLRASAATPPTFIVQAQDDPVDDVHESLVYYIALLNAGAPVEMHMYAHGGHAFGLRRSGEVITQWPDLAETWMRSIGMLPKVP